LSTRRLLVNIVYSRFFRIFAEAITGLILLYILSNTLGFGYELACIMIPVVFLMVYLFFTFKTPWIHLLLPFSLGNSTFLAALMIRNVVPKNVYNWVIILYASSIFALYHALGRMYSVFLKERKMRYRVVIEGVFIDLIIFIALSGIIISILMYYRAIIPLYGILLLLVEGFLPFIVYMLVIKGLIPDLLQRQIVFKGFTHPFEPEIEEYYFELSSITVIFTLLIPSIIAYTSTTLTRRAFIPLALLAVYECIVLAYYTITHMICLLGGFVESLLGDRIVDVEHYSVPVKWRDIGWFINRSLNYYIHMKFMIALYMLFQALEILSVRVNDRDIYYGSIHELLRDGYEKIRVNKLLSRFIVWSAIREFTTVFQPDKIYVLEPDVGVLNNTVYEDEYRRAFGSIVNAYCKMHELKNVKQNEVKQAIFNTVSRLEVLKKNASGVYRDFIEERISELKNLLSRDQIEPGDLERFLTRKPLTINMLRNYLVHGQLHMNAIVYMNSRVKADEILGKPSILYAIYTLLLVSITSRHPELFEKL